MKTLSGTIISLLAILVALAAPVFAEPPSVLLQEGLYAEEIEGDLDGAIKIYEQVLAEAKDIEQAAAQATYRIGLCHLKKGDKTKAASYFQSILREYPDNEQLVARAKEQLKKLGAADGSVGWTSEATLYERLPIDVIRLIGNNYGGLCTDAGAKTLYANSHIYYVTPDSMLYKGGMGYYHNTSGQAMDSKVRLSGTSYPDQTHYDISGRKMNTEITVDKVRPDFYHIYWTPYEPVAPGQMFYYGWCMNEPQSLPPAPGANRCKLEMQNQFGNRVMEAFYLVLPAGAEIVSKTEDYTSKDTVGGFDVYCFSKEVPEGENHQVDVVLGLGSTGGGNHVVRPGSNFFKHLPTEILAHAATKYGGISAEAGVRGLYSNSHIYFVGTDMILRTGGLGYYRNPTDQPAGGRIRLSGTSAPEQSLYDVAGRQMNVDIVPDEVRSNFYHIYWTPSEPIPPGQMFYYGWSSDDARKLERGAEGYKLRMQNQFGDRVVETFFLVVPVGMKIVDKTEDFTAKDTVGNFDIYYWSKEMPPNTNHVVDVTLSISQELVTEIVRKAVLTISTCTESDPKVVKSLDSLKPLDSGPVVGELCKYLDSDTATIRRSAIFILWRGEFEDIAAAEEKLIKLCDHEESLTRGMALLALGAAKAASAYDILADKTINGSDGYVRRCAAYALGLYGDKKALPVLEKALQDKDQMVKGNAQAAITMLTDLKDAGQK